MADEEKPSALDAALESFVHTTSDFLFPEHPEKSFPHKWLSIEGWVNFVGDWMISRMAFLVMLYVPLMLAASNLFPPFLSLTVSWFFLILPIIAPIGAIIGFANIWIWYVQSYYVFTRTNPVLLEVKMPAEVTKSPRAMEQVLTSFWIRSGTTTFVDRFWHGGLLPYASLEITSFGGEIHFYLWCRRGYRNMLESAMYSQYPEVEIVEVEDYATKFEYNPATHWCWATDYKYDTRSDVYPIKTYVDFELDKDPKEEHKVEPYASVLEVLSAMSKEEQVWIQIVLRGYFTKPDSPRSWQSKVVKEVEKIRDEASQQIDLDEGEPKRRVGFPRPTHAQTETMRNMERNVGKLAFDVGMRGMYIAPAGKGRSPEFSAYRWIWRPFNNPAFQNGLRPKGAHNDFDYLWQDWKGIRWNLVARRYFDAYRRRQFFHAPWITFTDEPMHMTTESIATLWHPPSSTVKTPGLQRIPVRKSEAPTNLPM